MALYSNLYSEVVNELNEAIDEWNDVNNAFNTFIPFRYEALNLIYQKWCHNKFVYFINEQIRIDYSNLLRDYYNLNNINIVVPLIQKNKTKWWNDININRTREYVGTLDVLIPEVKWIIISFI